MKDGGVIGVRNNSSGKHEFAKGGAMAEQYHRHGRVRKITEGRQKLTSLCDSSGGVCAAEGRVANGTAKQLKVTVTLNS